MTKDEAIAKMKEKGADDALNLRGRASTMDGTAIIAEESKVPDFDAQKCPLQMRPKMRPKLRINRFCPLCQLSCACSRQGSEYRCPVW